MQANQPSQAYFGRVSAHLVVFWHGETDMSWHWPIQGFQSWINLDIGQFSLTLSSSYYSSTLLSLGPVSTHEILPHQSKSCPDCGASFISVEWITFGPHWAKLLCCNLLLLKLMKTEVSVWNEANCWSWQHMPHHVTCKKISLFLEHGADQIYKTSYQEMNLQDGILRFSFNENNCAAPNQEQQIFTPHDVIWAKHY